jgi:hypothetical protein
MRMMPKPSFDAIDELKPALVEVAVIAGFGDGQEIRSAFARQSKLKAARIDMVIRNLKCMHIEFGCSLIIKCCTV